MRRACALGLVVVGIILGVLSIVQHTVRLVALDHGATFVGAAAALAVVAGAALWFVDQRQRTATGLSPDSSAQGAPASEGIATSMVGGRLRARGIPYVLPRDLEEMNRLDFQHYLLRQIFKGNFMAPVRNPRDVLDVGAGTGRWAREVAMIFPTSNVIGLDINPPPVDEKAEAGGPEVRPPNYAFVAGNVLEGLPFADASFDFVHMRLLVLALPHDRWPFVVNELIRVARLDGWVESVETMTLEGGGPAIDQIMTWISTLLQRRGIQFADGAHVGDLLRAQGLANVFTQRVELPFGEHGGRVGKLLATDFFTGMKGYGGLLEAQGVTTAAEFDRVVAEARQTTESPRVRCVSPFYIAYGQRRG